MNVRSFLLILFALAYMHDAQADDSRGRLPDGRAFRTDNEGNQLVDYIAELELSVDNLKRQVSGLEYDLQQKQAVIDSNGSGCSLPKLKETDLIKAPPSAQPAPVKAISCPACNCTGEIAEARTEAMNEARTRTEEAVRQAKAEAALQASNGSSELIKVRQELAQTRSDLERKQSQLIQLQSQLSRGSEAQKQLASVQSSISDAESRRIDAETRRTSAEQELASSKEELDAVSDKYEVLISEKEDLEEKLEDLRAENAALRQSHEKAEAQLAQAQEQAQQPRTQYVRNDQIPAPERPEMRAAFNMPLQKPTNARDVALDSLRGKIATNLNQIQGLIANRDRLYASYIKGPRPVDFTPASARSSSGMTVQQIRARSDEAQSVRELSLLTRDVNEIRSKIEFDIGMMERMKRLQ